MQGQAEPGAERHLLPQTLTPFVGRREEIADLKRLLATQGCRLLTVVGAGGIGKTRLAIEAARRWQEAGGDAAFVDLQPVQTTDLLIPAIAENLGLTQSGQEEPKRQLLHFLATRELLLVLDNFEHLTGGATLLSEVLQEAPGVKILVTSRTVLNLEEEWLYPAEGLRYPIMGNVAKEDVEAYDAVQFFVACAQRVRPDFQLEKEVHGVARLCRLVEGMPLAIELAAAWTKLLSPEAIADEIEKDLAFLSTSRRNTPEKHRSMSVVFERSWELLSDEERRVFRRLSLFQGGFERDAAVEVAGASLPVLATLVDKSLLRWRADGRYQIHELLRQFAVDRLAQAPEKAREAHAAFGDYYARFLQGKVASLHGGRQREALEEIDAELGNVRAAWRWAVREKQLAAIRAMGPTLDAAFRYRGRYREGLQSFEDAVNALREEPPTAELDLTLLRAFISVAWFSTHLGRLEDALRAWRRCQKLYEKVEVRPLAGVATDPLLGLSYIAWAEGDYEGAVAYAEKALGQARADDHLWNQHTAHNFLARFYLADGALEPAERHVRTGVALARKMGNRWLLAHSFSDLGNVLSTKGEYEAAGENYRKSCTIWEEFGDYGSMATALDNLGKVALKRGAYDEAVASFVRSLEMGEKISSTAFYTIMARTSLGETFLALNRPRKAAAEYRKALEATTEIGFLPHLLVTLAGVGKLFLQEDKEERGLALLTLVHHHPLGDAAVKEEAGRQIASIDPGRLAEGAAAKPALEPTVEEVMGELAELAAPAAEDAEPATNEPLVQLLPEPLSERELEVMGLIAAGLKNREIAEELYIALSTVKSHIKNIYGKMGVSNRVQAVSRARELNLIE